MNLVANVWRGKLQRWRVKLDCFSLVVTVRIQRLVCHLVALDSFEEVVHDPLSVSLRVVWTGHFHFLPKTFSTFNWGELAGQRLLHNTVDNTNINRLWLRPLLDEVVVKRSAWLRTLVHTRILAAMTSGSSQTDSTKNTCWKYTDSEQLCVKKPQKKKNSKHSGVCWFRADMLFAETCPVYSSSFRGFLNAV